MEGIEERKFFMKTRYDRMAVAREALATLVPMVQSKLGSHRTADARMPEHFECVCGEMNIIYTPSVVCDPVIRRPQSVLDIWLQGQGKVFSLVWEPMTIVCFKDGEWVDTIKNLSARRVLQ
jgi:hypothetical protein